MSQFSKVENFWDAVKPELESRFTGDVFSMWFQPMNCLQQSDNEVVLSVPNEFSAIWVEDNYLELISDKIRYVAGRPMQVSLKVFEESSKSREQEFDLGLGKPIDDNARGEVVGSEQRAKGSRGTVGNFLNPKNTFENFVVGQNNNLAHAAAVAIATSPAKAYNPLFIYSDTGLGKTHLMHAVGHFILKHNRLAKVAYVSTEKFTNEFIRAIQENTLVKFRRRYRSVDVLLIDDIHFLSRKERIQEEFFHTFNDLFESGKQIFLTSDRPASEISKLESRLVSRFQWGLVSDMQAPDLETRVAILSNKANSLGMQLPEDVLQFIAEKVSRNIRRLEGALTRVASYNALMGKNVNLEVAEQLLGDILQEEAQNRITVEKIQKRVADYFNLRLSDMISRRRPANIAFPRQIAMYLSRILTSHPLQEIGESFGGRDHGTVIHACKTVENIMDQDESVRRSVEYLKSQLAKNTG
ncbi:MAG: chromosomal replication initiator protein DnaA [Opitutaceae bacterium]|nr:chromosomal replication initiator protein DnaA [Opitutaceae bacterium]